jgi:hypothetical protein
MSYHSNAKLAENDITEHYKLTCSVHSQSLCSVHSFPSKWLSSKTQSAYVPM